MYNKLDNYEKTVIFKHLHANPTLSHDNSYVFYEVANSYDLTRTICLNPSDR